MTDTTYKVRIILTGGGKVDIVSPIPAEQMQHEMVTTISEKISDPAWMGWYAFRKSDGKKIGMNVRMIAAIEEI